MLRRDGWTVGRSLVWPPVPRGGPGLAQQAVKAAQDGRASRATLRSRTPERAWSLDFIHDQLSQGTKFRALTVVDIVSREGLAIEVGQRLRGKHVVEVLNRLVRQRGAPKYLLADNGAEFTGRLVDLCAYHHGVRLDVSRPGKPTDHAFIETFNGSLRDECLNLHWFETLAGARAEIEAWRRDCNESRPHMALGQRTPQEYLSQTSP
jgi:putative transposase